MNFRLLKCVPGPGLTMYVGGLVSVEPGAVGQNRGILVLKELLIMSFTVPTTLTFSWAYAPGPGCSLARLGSLSFIELKGATLQEPTKLKLITMFLNVTMTVNLNLLLSGLLRVLKWVVCAWGDIIWRWDDEMLSYALSPL